MKRTQHESLSELRSYQKTAVERIVTELRRRSAQDRNAQPWVLCALPTGSGKTIVGVVAAARAAKEVGSSNVIWLAHQKELLDRALKELEDAERTGLIPGDVVFHYLTIQEFLNARLPQGVGLIVFDEAHHLHSNQQWITDLRRRRRPVLGLTATPRRSFQSDGWRLVNYVTRDALTPHYLAPPVLITERTGFTPKHVGQKMLGSVAQLDFDADTYRALDTEQRNEIVAQTLARRRDQLAPMLVYVSRIEHAEHLALRLEAHGVLAAYVHGKTRPSERDEIFDLIRRGRLHALVNVNLVSEGVDLPELRSIVMAVPTMSDIRFAQMLGRGCRKTKDKRSFFLVDFVDNLGAFQEMLDGRHLYDGVTSKRDRYDPADRRLLDEYRFDHEPPEQPYLAQLRKALTKGFLRDDLSGLLPAGDIERHLLSVATRANLPLSKDGCRPREVPFVHEFIFPLIKERNPTAGVRKEVMIEEGMRCDILVQGSPHHIIEFAATRVSSTKVEQLLGYRQAFKNETGVRAEATLVAVSLNGSTRSRRFQHGRTAVDFVNWHDFIRDLTESQQQPANRKRDAP